MSVHSQKIEKSTVKWLSSILYAQSTFQKPTEIQSGLLFKTKAQALLSSSQVNKLLSLR